MSYSELRIDENQINSSVESKKIWAYTQTVLENASSLIRAGNEGREICETDVKDSNRDSGS